MSATVALPQPLTSSLHTGIHTGVVAQFGRLTGESVSGGPDVEAVDLDRLLEMVDHDPTQLREVVAMYLNESTRGIGELWAAIQAGDREQTERLAHRLCGTAAMCGMVGVVAPLRAIEISADSGGWSRIQLLMLEARRQHSRVVDCLEELGLDRAQHVSTAPALEEGR